MARPEAIPTPVENKGSKPYRIYLDVYGDPDSRSHRPVTEAMSALLVCAPPTEPLGELRRLLSRQRLPGVPITAPDQTLLGMVTWVELLTAPPGKRADEVMRRGPAFPAWTSIGKAAAILSMENLEVAAVVDYDRRVLGVISALDVARWLAANDGYIVAPRRE
jgi:CBS domain-containing protein